MSEFCELLDSLIHHRVLRVQPANKTLRDYHRGLKTQLAPIDCIPLYTLLILTPTPDHPMSDNYDFWVQKPHSHGKTPFESDYLLFSSNTMPPGAVLVTITEYNSKDFPCFKGNPSPPSFNDGDSWTKFNRQLQTMLPPKLPGQYPRYLGMHFSMYSIYVQD